MVYVSKYYSIVPGGDRSDLLFFLISVFSMDCHFEYR